MTKEYITKVNELLVETLDYVHSVEVLLIDSPVLTDTYYTLKGKVEDLSALETLNK